MLLYKIQVTRTLSFIDQSIVHSPETILTAKGNL